MRAVAPALMVSQLALSEGSLLHKLHSVSGLELGSLLQLDLLGALGPVSEAAASGQENLARATRSAQATLSLGIGRSQDSL